MAFQINSSQLLAHESRIIGETIQNIFEQGNIAKLTTDLGFDVNAGFLPLEAKEYSKGVVEYVLNTIKRNQLAESCYQEDREPIIREFAIPLIEGEISKVCKLVPRSQISYPDVRIGSLISLAISWVFPSRDTQ